jgi:hypothetical protein
MGRKNENPHLVGRVGGESSGEGQAFELGLVGPPGAELREGAGELVLRDAVPAVAEHLQRGAARQEEAVALDAAPAVDHRRYAGGYLGDAVVVVVVVDGRGGVGGAVGRERGRGGRAVGVVHGEHRLLGAEELVHFSCWVDWGSGQRDKGCVRFRVSKI